MKVKHYFLFNGDSSQKKRIDESMWGSLRTDSNNPSFSVEDDVVRYEEN